MALKAKTFVDDLHQIEVDILTGPVNGLCKVAYGQRVLVRHVDRLAPMSDEAAKFLHKSEGSPATKPFKQTAITKRWIPIKQPSAA